MYFKDFPQFLYDFKYSDGKTKTTVVRDITRNVRFRKEVLSNITIFDEYDMVDGETPEIISEKFYGTPEYHWVIMLANEKYDWTTDFPLEEGILQRHIDTIYNPKLSSIDWFWDTHDDNKRYIHIKITSTDVPFEAAYLTSPVWIKLYDDTSTFVKIIDFPSDFLGLDEATQYFYFEYDQPWDITQFGKPGATYASGVGNIRINIQTKGREHNPIAFLDINGMPVDPKQNPYAIPITGAEIARAENNEKRKIKIISPKVLETVIKNYEELLR